jgi:predicted AAA+ superfamily ATPase
MLANVGTKTVLSKKGVFMPSILDACTPRQDILQGTFNPEIFTPSLSAALAFYAGKASGLHAMYTDAKQFFGEATYPTDGLKMVVSEVFTRIAGDNSVPAIHRLETAFGGGKTHALIACAHIGHQGTKLAGVCDHIIAKDLLPKPGDLCVVGVAGDEIPVHKTVGAKLMPYTLRGEIAQQIGGEALYSKLGETAISRAAPGKDYFDTVLGGKKVLIMLDELAQYAARLSAAHPGGGE